MTNDLPCRRTADIHVDVRKFHEYVLDPARAGGKDGVFIGLLGFRASHLDDAAELAALHEQQARVAVDEGAVQVGRPTSFGLRCTIVVTVRGIPLRSGWLLEPGGRLRLVTPFSGFASSGEDRR